MSKKCIALVVEANEGVRELLEAFLPAEGYNVRLVASAEELSKLLDSPAEDVGFFDAIIIGDPVWRQGSPMESWLSLARQVKETFPGVPVISFSVDIQSDERFSWADYNIQKPGIDELQETIRGIRDKVKV